MRNDKAPAESFIGIAGLACAAFLYGYSAIALPSWLHSLLMPLLWLVFFAVGCRWFIERPRRVSLAAALSIVVWFALMIGFGPEA